MGSLAHTVIDMMLDWRNKDARPKSIKEQSKSSYQMDKGDYVFFELGLFLQSYKISNRILYNMEGYCQKCEKDNNCKCNEWREPFPMCLSTPDKSHLRDGRTDYYNDSDAPVNTTGNAFTESWIRDIEKVLRQYGVSELNDLWGGAEDYCGCGKCRDYKQCTSKGKCTSTTDPTEYAYLCKQKKHDKRCPVHPEHQKETQCTELSPKSCKKWKSCWKGRGCHTWFSGDPLPSNLANEEKLRLKCEENDVEEILSKIREVIVNQWKFGDVGITHQNLGK